MIRKENGEFCVYSSDGSRKFGCYPSEGQAQKRLKQIEYFKHVKSKEVNMAAKDCKDCMKNGGYCDMHPKAKADVHKQAILMVAAKLDPNAEVRNRGNVVFPANSKKVKDHKDHFPINNENQARNALSRVGQYSSVPPWYAGSLDELKKAVQNAVKNKYSGIDVTKGELTTTVKTPPGNPAKVPQVDTPSLKGAKNASQVYAAIAAMSPEAHKAFASTLVKELQMQQTRLTDAITLAEKLLDEGVTPEEFGMLASYTQYDILSQLIQ